MNSNGLITVASRFRVGEMLDHLTTALTKAGLRVFARIDHASGAQEVGLSLRPTELLIFGHPKGVLPSCKTSRLLELIFLEVRRKILTGEYSAHQLLLPKQIEDAYQINNTTTQMLLMRLANEGLIKILPVKKRTWPNNASLNEYRVTDLQKSKTLVPRLHAKLPDLASETDAPEKETLLLKIQYADAEIAQLLGLAEGEKVVVYRERSRQADQRVVAISDLYVPFWFADVLPDLEQTGSDPYQLMRRIGKEPITCIETVEMVQARSVERVLFELSLDDPTPLFKLQRQTLNADDHPLAIEFLTLRGDSYRLRYTFSL